MELEIEKVNLSINLALVSYLGVGKISKVTQVRNLYKQSKGE